MNKLLIQGNSIYATKANVLESNYQLVKVLKFSNFLKSEKINIIRINIEGAESHVVT